jgi:hypothetical protein
MFVSGQDKSPKARRLVGHVARQALCWTRVRREPLINGNPKTIEKRRSGKLGVRSPGRSVWSITYS